MRNILFLLINVTLLTFSPCSGQESVIDLSPGKPFPIIAMPDSESGELMSITDFRGEKLMLQIFASW